MTKQNIRKALKKKEQSVLLIDELKKISSRQWKSFNDLYSERYDPFHKQDSIQRMRVFLEIQIVNTVI